MPVITSIKPQKNNKRVNVYLDGKFSFGLDLENYLKFHLKVEQELSRKEVDEIVKNAEFQKSLDRLLRFSTTRPRSEKEVKDYLKRKEVPESLHEELFNRLNRLELLNDQKFAKWWIDQRLEFKSKSKKDLTFELRQKGIDSQTIKNVIDDSEMDEVKIAKKIIEKKSYKWQRFDEEVRKQKIMQYLSGKGFGWDVIQKVS